MTDEKRSLYEPALEAFSAGEITAPERRPTLRPEDAYETDENLIVRAARAQREVWEIIEQQAAEIERLRAAGDALLIVARGIRDCTGQGAGTIQRTFEAWEEARRD